MYDRLATCISTLGEMFENDLDVLSHLPASYLVDLAISLIKVHSTPSSFLYSSSLNCGDMQLEEREAQEAVAQALALIGDMAAAAPDEMQAVAKEKKHIILHGIYDQFVHVEETSQKIQNNALWATGTSRNVHEIAFISDCFADLHFMQDCLRCTRKICSTLGG